MNKLLIVIMFILLGTSLIVVSNMNKGVENSFTIEYQSNKNLALPDFTGKEAIAPNLFRLYSQNGFTFDYNLSNGQYTMNGTTTSTIIYAFTNHLNLDIWSGNPYYMKMTVLSGSSSEPFRPVIAIGNSGGLNNDINGNTRERIVTNYATNDMLYIFPGNGVTYNNFTFTLQLEKGQIATSYVVPKLIPVYKDNLTQQEKQEIGFGAFGGLSQIIRSVDNVIKPIGNFINGVLNLFK